jgi:hypothetical protein
VLMAVHKDCYTSLNLTNKAAAAGGILSICTESKFVMAGLVPAIHALLWRSRVDARDKRGHDGGNW